MSTWHTPETVRAEWEDAEQIGNALLAQLVTAARDAVTAFAPALPAFSPTAEQPDQPIPDRYRLGQLMQVRNLWSAVDTASSGDLGGETFTYQPRPLDWHVKALLRPQRGRPRVG
ncbi:hypothetical protein [Microbacterium hydrocarbonoxydans]|uniref:hypothetical protein n=1 Tax=Microbacterium hydrocarbonoxydans TaxID=273678 RepID=UPI003D95C955